MLVEEPRGLDGDGVAVVRAQRHADLEVCRGDPRLLGLGPEGVFFGGCQFLLAVRRDEEKFGEVLVVLGDDQVGDLAWS